MNGCFCRDDIPHWDPTEMVGPLWMLWCLSFPLLRLTLITFRLLFDFFPHFILLFTPLQLITSLRETLKDGGTEYPPLCPNTSLGLASLVVLA